MFVIYWEEQNYKVAYLVISFLLKNAYLYISAQKKVWKNLLQLLECQFSNYKWFFFCSFIYFQYSNHSTVKMDFLCTKLILRKREQTLFLIIFSIHFPEWSSNWMELCCSAQQWWEAAHRPQQSHEERKYDELAWLESPGESVYRMSNPGPRVVTAPWDFKVWVLASKESHAGWNPCPSGNLRPWPYLQRPWPSLQMKLGKRPCCTWVGFKSNRTTPARRGEDKQRNTGDPDLEAEIAFMCNKARNAITEATSR